MTLIANIRFAGESDTDGWILIDDLRISAVGRGEKPDADIVIDGRGALALPGAIDCHVHFREPGLTAKADIRSESRAAIAGGVTSYLEMPNTRPATTTIEFWQQKMDIAEHTSAANYAFFIGATNDNIEELKRADYTRVPGVKLFLGSSTGNMLVDNASAITRIFREVPALVAVHAEDQTIISRLTEEFKEKSGGEIPVKMHSALRPVSACYEASRKAAEIARATNHRLHICHITSEVELSLLSEGDISQRLITGEVSPHHLMWCDGDYDKEIPGRKSEDGTPMTLGSRIKMNPAVKSASDRDALCRAVTSGAVDIVATDHAPHCLCDKEGDALHAASGAPLVQFSLPWMLTHFHEDVVQRVMCENPAKLFGIANRGTLAPGNYADIVLIDHNPELITDEKVLSKCGWTPLDGQSVDYRVTHTWVNGVLVYRDGEFTDRSAAMPLRFGSTSV